ncbi:MAG: Mrp/NBP35 family ATP-binding protein [Bacteroidota bacterium]
MDINTIKQELSKITDPDLGIALGDLNAIKNITISEDVIFVEIELVQPLHWVTSAINDTCAKVLSETYPGYKSELVLTERQQDYYSRESLKGVKNIIAVSSGKGGVGKSAIAANIASALSLSGAAVGILDADIYGPSQPTMFGIPDEAFDVEEKEDGKVVAYPRVKHGIKVASMGFAMNRDQAAIIRGPLLAGYFTMLFEQLEWGNLDFLIIDLPPGTGDVQLTMTQKLALSGAVIVTTPQEVSLADVRRGIAMFNKVDVDILGIIENMSYFTAPELPDKKYYIFGKGGGQKTALENNIPFLGEVPLDIKMRESNDGGTPIVLANDGGKQAEILRNISAKLISELRKRNFKVLENDSLKIEL